MNWIDKYLEYTKDSEPPESFRKWVAIGLIAACLQRKCFVYPPWAPEEPMYPNFYILLVGQSGEIRKGFALSQGRKFLKDVDVRMASKSVTSASIIEEMIEAQQKTQYAGYVPLNHASLTVFSEEFTVFIGYKNNEFLAYLCDWYDCHPEWGKRTRSRGDEKIVGVFLNIIGATTPHLLQTSLPGDAVGGGFASRMIIVHERHVAKKISWVNKYPEMCTLRNDLLEDLRRIKRMSGEFTYHDSMIQPYDHWYRTHTADSPALIDPRFAGYVSRRPTHLIKLCMVMSAAKDNEMIITKDVFDRAVNDLYLVEQNMPRAFEGFGQHILASIQADVLRFIEEEVIKTGEDKIYVRRILENFHNDLLKDDLGVILGSLDARGHIVIPGEYNPTNPHIVYTGHRKMKG